MPYTLGDLIATTVLWLAGLAAALLIFSETASPYYQQEPGRTRRTEPDVAGARLAVACALMMAAVMGRSVSGLAGGEVLA